MFDSETDVTYQGLVDVPLGKDGKPTRSWMKDWTQEERTEKFFEFCRAYDKREDSLLKTNYQQFSHRLHWDECPFVDSVSNYRSPSRVLEACLLFSFTNEHNLTFEAWAQGRLGEWLVSTQRPCRSDLFQIYYPAGTKVKEWLAFAPAQAASALGPALVAKNRPWTMMELAKEINKYMVEHLGFRNAMYPSKNAARHVAMSHPEWCDPESFLHGGTGFFDGFSQVFDVPSLMSKTKYEIDDVTGAYVPSNPVGWRFGTKMAYLKNHSSNPMKRQKLLNLEDKLCFFYKHMAITQGVKKLTPQIPYDWVYPWNWSLKTGKYASIPRTDTGISWIPSDLETP